jgi:hypothetical protein
MAAPVNFEVASAALIAGISEGPAGRLINRRPSAIDIEMTV